jgi:hypothetical protein
VVGIYSPLSISIGTTPATPVEGKNFTVNFLITNPSGVSVSNVQFTLPVPSGLALSHLQSVQVSGGSLTISSATLAPHSSVRATAVAVASSGIIVPFDKGRLTFSYSGVTVSGVVPTTKGIAVGEDVTTRYLIPTGFVILVLLLTAFYVRRKAAPSAPVPQR